MMGPNVHTVLYDTMYPEPVGEFMELQALYPHSKPDYFLLYFFRTQFIGCRIGFSFSYSKNEVSFLNDIFEMPQVIKSFS